MNIAFLNEHSVVRFLAKNTTLEKIVVQHGSENIYVETSENIRVGMTYISGEFITPEPTIVDPQIEINATALAYLAATDWYVLRFAETGVITPADVATKRADAREAIV
ncbi:MAG: hypothetical protein OCD03_02900 [Hyphomicrobiales bacterium]